MQPVLSSKYESVLFLHSLASSTKTPLLAPSLLPSLAPSPPMASKHTPDILPVDTPQPPQPQRKGRSKAELLREVRARSGKITASSTRWPTYDMGNRML